MLPTRKTAPACRFAMSIAMDTTTASGYAVPPALLVRVGGGGGDGGGGGGGGGGGVAAAGDGDGYDGGGDGGGHYNSSPYSNHHGSPSVDWSCGAEPEGQEKHCGMMTLLCDYFVVSSWVLAFSAVFLPALTTDPARAWVSRQAMAETTPRATDEPRPMAEATEELRAMAAMEEASRRPFTTEYRWRRPCQPVPPPCRENGVCDKRLGRPVFIGYR